METSDLIARASAGDHNAFRELVEVHSHELQVHCYRILGSVQDAEDALQETLVSAWRNLGDFGQRSSLRTWLYQIATNRCLSMLRADSRRPRTAIHLPDLTLPEPTAVSDVPPWLEPYPDVLLDNLVDQAPGPEARYETTEAISLAFITALQLLPPRQRAVLVLRDVLGYRAGEVAGMLDATQESVQSALKRARATVDSHLADSGSSRLARQPDTTAERHLVAQLTDALERADVQALVGGYSQTTSGSPCRPQCWSTGESTWPVGSSQQSSSGPAGPTGWCRPEPTASQRWACTWPIPTQVSTGPTDCMSSRSPTTASPRSPASTRA
jgi:RNA polymerase sigma-70 factor (ECF subfamily)